MVYSAYFFKEYKREISREDALFLNLFLLKNRKRETLIEREKQCIYNLKGKIINDLPIIGSFCKNKCILEDVKFFADYTDYRFKFDKEAIKLTGERPIKIISTLFIEGRYYFKKGVTAILANGEEEERTVLSIIYTIEDYVKLKLSSGLEFTYASPKYKELTMDKAQMEVINRFLKYKLRASELDGNEDNVRSIKLDGFTTRIQDDSSLLKSFFPKKKLKIMGFSYKDLKV